MHPHVSELAQVCTLMQTHTHTHTDTHTHTQTHAHVINKPDLNRKIRNSISIAVIYRSCLVLGRINTLKCSEIRKSFCISIYTSFLIRLSLIFRPTYTSICFCLWTRILLAMSQLYLSMSHVWYFLFMNHVLELWMLLIFSYTYLILFTALPKNVRASSYTLWKHNAQMFSCSYILHRRTSIIMRSTNLLRCCCYYVVRMC